MGRDLMNQDPGDGIIELDEYREAQRPNRTCDVCGGSWWRTPGITVDTAGVATGYALPLSCVDCEPDAPVLSIQGQQL